VKEIQWLQTHSFSLQGLAPPLLFLRLDLAAGAEAIVDTTVCIVKRDSLEREATKDPAMMRSLLTMTSNNLEHVENHLVLLGRKTATERVKAFLLEMNHRLTTPGVMALPMDRQDIADYLGLTMETVSRVLAALQREGHVKVAGRYQREIIVLHPPDLAEQNRRSFALRAFE